MAYVWRTSGVDPFNRIPVFFQDHFALEFLGKGQFTRINSSFMGNEFEFLDLFHLCTNN